jgi:hypothetical protein
MRCTQTKVVSAPGGSAGTPVRSTTTVRAPDRSASCSSQRASARSHAANGTTSSPSAAGAGRSITGALIVVLLAGGLR